MTQDNIRDRKVGRSLLVRTALGAAVAAAVIAANTAARAGDDDEDGASVTTRIFRTLGLKGPSAGYDGINYSERSPLVVPPTRDLPPPVSTAAPPVPNWPKDQDLERREKVKKDDKARYQKDYVVDSSRPLRPDEYGAKGGSTNAPGDGDSSADSLMADPRDKGAKKSLFSNVFKKDEFATFTGEPVRETLTDPPPGYLTPSPNQPYGIGQKTAPYKVQTLGERMEPTR